MQSVVDYDYHLPMVFCCIIIQIFAKRAVSRLFTIKAWKNNRQYRANLSYNSSW